MEMNEFRKSLRLSEPSVDESLTAPSITSSAGIDAKTPSPGQRARLVAAAEDRQKQQSSTDTSALVRPSVLRATTVASTPPPSAMATTFNPENLRGLKIQSQLQPHSAILKQLELEMSQSPQATILRRMKEEARNEEETSLTRLEDERIIALEKEAKRRELEYLLAEEVPLIIGDMLRVLTQWMDDLKGDTEEQNREREVQETLEQERARLRKKVALSLDSMLKHGRKEKEEEEAKPPEQDEKGPKRNHVLEFNKKTEGDITTLRGYAAISGWRIYKSELRLKVNPTWGKKLPVTVKAQVSPLYPLHVPQVRNAYNYMRMAIGELKRLERLISKNGGKADERSLTDAFKRIKDELQMAREELVTNEVHEFPDNVFSPSGFLPALPPDVAVEFHVFQSQLILSVYILQISPVPAKLARQPSQPLNASGAAIVDPSPVGRNRLPKHHMLQLPTVGQTYVVQGKKVEIMDGIRIPCDVPALKNVVGALEQANDMANELQDKLLAVS